ncbi:MAG: AraC family transcriptional regulator [Candidatus Eisenbacteria bacterium]
MAQRALPESCSTTLFVGELFELADWRCAGHDTRGREDEWCDADRVVVTRRGAYELSQDGEAALVDPATVTFWRQGSYYRVRHPLEGGDDCTVFRLRERGTRLLADARRGVFARRARPLAGRAYLAQRVALERARQGFDDVSVEEPALEFLRSCADAPDPEPPACVTRAAREQVEHARQVIARDFRDRLSMLSVARQAGCSAFHLSRQFRRVTGASLHRTLIRTRLRAALEQLLDTPERLVMIALEAGFASHSHFTDAFRAEYGCAPSAARARFNARAPEDRPPHRRR